MADPIRAAVVGGASPLVLSLLHGLADRAGRWAASEIPLYLSLTDVAPARAGRWVRYSLLLQEETGLPLYTGVAPGCESAIRDASVVLLAEPDPEPWDAFQELQEKYAWLSPSPDVRVDEHAPAAPSTVANEGLLMAAAAASLWPFCRRLGESVRRAAPSAMLLVCSGPADVLAAAVQRATGCCAAGVSGDVDETRLWLSRALDVSPEQIGLDHAGVRGDGVAFGFRVAGADLDSRLQRLVCSLADRSDLAPLERSVLQSFLDTGSLRCSPPPAAHCAPGDVEVEQALDRRQSLWAAGAANGSHPNWPGRGLGRTLEHLLWARASGETEILPLQVINHDFLPGFPEGGPVEVPVAAAGSTLEPCLAGPPPERVGGLARQRSLQRKLLIDWLVDEEYGALVQALNLFPPIVEATLLRSFVGDLCRLIRLDGRP